MSALSKEYANSSGTSMVIEIKLLERRDLMGWWKRVKISTVLVQCVKFLTSLSRHKKMGLGAYIFYSDPKNQIFLVGFTPGGLGGFGV
jgi:hypothetical protein